MLMASFFIIYDSIFYLFPSAALHLV